jgi:transposase-like protein
MGQFSKGELMLRDSTARVFSGEFKLSAVRRMLAGENVSALARELAVLRKDLYVWRDRFRAGGPEALRPPARPRKVPLTERPPDPPPDPAGGARKLAAAGRASASSSARSGSKPTRCVCGLSSAFSPR